MKIVSWNLRNIGTNKLPKEFDATYSAFGLGGSCLDFITKVVTGNNAWLNIQSDKPADVFVIIELKSGGRNQGQAGTSSCLVVLPRILNAMNAIVAARADSANYSYASVTPLITGYHETVGIIYNTKALEVKSSSVPNNSSTRKELSPRGPFLTRFALKAAPTTSLYITGIHAPPPKGGAALKYRNPINYNRQLAATGIGALANSFVVGDFNCNPASSYVNSGTQVFPFANFTGFQSKIANGTLSSVRKSINTTSAPPANYLSDAYDNILFNYAVPGTAVGSVMDLIGSARNMNAAGTPNAFASNADDVFDAYKVLSDHLPVIIEY